MKFILNIFKKKDERLERAMRAATKIRMDEASRARMRAHLSEYVQFRPIRVHGSRHVRHHYRFATFFSSHIRPMPVIAAILVVAISGGTVAASESALPGDILYSVKVRVTEEVQAALARTPKAQADWAIVRAERRLEEAATLALGGNLNDTTRAELEINLDEHMRSAAKSRQQLEGEKNDSAAADVRTSIGAVSVARENILGGPHKSAANAAAGKARTESASETSSATSTVVSDEKPEISARGNRTAAKARIEAAKRFLESNPKLDARASTKAAAQLKVATDILSSGDEKSSRGDRKDAASAFKRALEAATEVGALISQPSED